MEGCEHDMQATGAQCKFCGRWCKDFLDGYDPPGYPRACEVCATPTKANKPGKLRHSGGQGGATVRLTKDTIRRRRSAWGEVYKKLGEEGLQVYSNNGCNHLKYFGRFNYWFPRGKWWDSVTNQQGQGAASFVAHVQNKAKTLGLQTKENTHAKI